eukprot:gene1458-1838_t
MLIGSSLVSTGSTKRMYKLEYKFPIGIHQLKVNVTSDQSSSYINYGSPYGCLPFPNILQFEFSSVVRINREASLYNGITWEGKFRIPTLEKFPASERIACKSEQSSYFQCDVIVNYSALGVFILRITTKSNSDFSTIPNSISITFFDPQNNVNLQTYLVTLFQKSSSVANGVITFIPNSATVSTSNYNSFYSIYTKFDGVTNYNSSTDGSFITVSGVTNEGNRTMIAEPILGSSTNMTLLSKYNIKTTTNQIIKSYSYGLAKNPTNLVLSNTITNIINSNIVVPTSPTAFNDFKVLGMAVEFGLTTYNEPIPMLLYPNFLMNLEYPYSFCMGTVKSFTAYATFLIDEYYTGRCGGTIKDLEVRSIDCVAKITDNQSPTIESLSIIPFGSRFLFRVEAKDDYSGIYSITVDSCTLLSTDLVFGTLKQGRFEKICFLTGFTHTPQVTLKDLAGNNITYHSNINHLYFNMDLISPIPFYPYYDTMLKNNEIFSEYSVSYFKFEGDTQRFDLSEVGKWNRLFVNFTLYIPGQVPSIEIKYRYSNGRDPNSMDYNNVFEGEWIDSIKLYVIEFYIPARLISGPLNYLMCMQPYCWEYSQLDYLRPNFEPILNIFSSEGDQFPPIITEISEDPSQISIGTDTDALISWTVRIEDTVNGLEKGYLEITSDFDFEPYVFTFTPNNAISGNKTNGVYKFSIPINGNCRTQTYRITKVRLWDTQDQYSATDDPIYINPMYTQFTKIDDSAIRVECTMPLDTKWPSLQTFSYSPWVIDVGATNPRSRTIDFSFSVRDDTTGTVVSGISPRHSPVIYLKSLGQGIISMKSTVTSNTTNTWVYTCSIEVPYAYGLENDDGLVITAFGLVDKHLNIGGHPQLATFFGGITRDAVVNTTFSNSPLIESVSKIKSYSSYLTIYGHGFGVDRELIQFQVDYKNGSNYLPISSKPEFFSGIALSVDIGKNSNPYDIRVVVGSKTSNSITVIPQISQPTELPSPTPSNPPTTSTTTTSNPTTTSSTTSTTSTTTSSTTTTTSTTTTISPSPSPTPPTYIECEGKPKCGGSDHGTCTENGCQCKSPWMGNDCQSQQIIIPTPPIPKTPEFNLNYTFYSSIISVVAIREFDPKDVLVQQINLDKWIMTNISSDNEIKFIYTTNFTKNDIQTVINTTVEWFTNDREIEFANRQIKMKAGTLKYKIDMNSYGYSHSVNRIELIMSAKFSSNQNDDSVCSYFEYKNATMESDTEYIKLQVSNTSLYGKFIRFGQIDDKVRTVSTRLLNENLEDSNTHQSQTFIAIKLPNYSKFLTLDPDFSLLTDYTDAKDKDGSICKKRNGLSAAKIAGIVIAAFCVAAIIIISVSYYIYKKKQHQRMEQEIGKKLKNINYE